MWRAIVVLTVTTLLAGCGWETGTSRLARADAGLPPPGSVARGSGVQAAARAVPPAGLDRSALQRGSERYAIFCTPCHGADGTGDGPVVRRGFPKPASLHEPRLRAAPADHIVRVISEGIGAMYPLAERVPTADRWAIAAYVQEMQRQGRGRAP